MIMYSLLITKYWVDELSECFAMIIIKHCLFKYSAIPEEFTKIKIFNLNLCKTPHFAYNDKKVCLELRAFLRFSNDTVKLTKNSK